MKSVEIDGSMYTLSFICMNERVMRKFNLKYHGEIKEYFFKCCFIFAIQSMIMIFVFYSIMEKSDGKKYEKPTVQNMSLRLLCSYLFHLGNYGDVQSSFKKLKYLVHHPEKFINKKLEKPVSNLVPAFFITVFQFSTGFCCEVMSMVCLTR